MARSNAAVQVGGAMIDLTTEQVATICRSCSITSIAPENLNYLWRRFIATDAHTRSTEIGATADTPEYELLKLTSTLQRMKETAP